MKKKRRKEGWQLKRMRRPTRLADARQWLSAHGGADVPGDYAQRYGVDPLCALLELRQLGVLISEEHEAQVRDAVARRVAERAARRAKVRADQLRAEQARAEKRAARKRASRERAAAWAAAPADSYGDDEPAEWGWDGEIEYGWDDESFEAAYDPAPGFTPDRFGDEEPWSIEDTLREEARALDLRVVEEKIERLAKERVRVRLILAGDPDLLARCAWSLMFTIGALSFDDADTDLDFAERDEWTAGDMLRCLAFEQGRLRFRAGEVRGRSMKTTVEIDPEGKITLATADRGEAALQWIRKLQGTMATRGSEDEASWDRVPF
jgi:hypothetical protein